MLTGLKNYLHCRSGNMALGLAAALVPLLIGVGVALDLSTTRTTKSSLQDAVDSAVLAAASFEGSATEREAHGEMVFATNIAGLSAENTPAIDLQVLGDGRVTASSQTEVPTAIMGMFGAKAPVIHSYAESAMTGIKPSEIVFVLDYSSSMDGQYEPMRDAVTTLINQVTENGIRTDIKIGLVPFAREVYMSIDGRYVVGGINGVTWSNCTVSRDWPAVWKDDTPTVAQNSRWGLLDDDYAAVTNADYYDECVEYTNNNLTVSPLTTNHTNTLAQLQAMTPYEGTNITVGMTVGFQVVSPNAPFTQGASYSDDDWGKYIILLSDGSHNKPGFGPGGVYDEDQGRANLQYACDEAQAKGITVITVAYELDDASAEAALQNCASDTRFYLKGQEQDIANIFERIGGFFGNQPYLLK